MKCPVDQTTLVMAERHGVEIDYCPTCRGIWLDRGELDKIIARAEGPAAAPMTAPVSAPVTAPMGSPVTLREPSRSEPPRRDDWQPRSDRRRRDDDDDDDYRRPRKRRESFLSDLFDF